MRKHSSPWHPKNHFGTLHMWDARRNDLITTATGVSSLAAVTSGTPALVQGTEASQPALSTLNGVQALSFDGTDDWMETATNLDLSGTNAISIFVLLSASNNNSVVIEQSYDYNAVPGFIIFRNGDKANAGFSVPPAYQGAVTDADFVSGVGCVVSTTMQRTGVAAQAVFPWVNLSQGSTPTSANAIGGTFPSDVLNVGARSGVISPIQGKIVILAIVPRLVSDFERTMMVRWLAAQGRVSI